MTQSCHFSPIGEGLPGKAERGRGVPDGFLQDAHLVVCGHSVDSRAGLGVMSLEEKVGTPSLCLLEGQTSFFVS